jgi:hypothetical protein
VIRHGWDWLGVFPSRNDRIRGVVELPALAECLTLNKGDFVRSGPRGATYLGYRRAIQEVVQRQLAEWGDAQDPADQSRRRAARPVERDLERVLMDLADQFPLLASLVEQRVGGQRKLPFAGRGGASPADTRILTGPAISLAASAAESAGSAATAATEPDSAVAFAQPEPEEADRSASGPADPIASIRKRPSRYGLAIEFEERPGDLEPGRLVESTVFVNTAHPAYRRAVQSRSEGYHLAMAVALALAPLTVGSAQEHAFVTTFLARWGEAVTPASRRRR